MFNLEGGKGSTLLKNYRDFSQNMSRVLSFRTAFVISFQNMLILHII